MRDVVNIDFIINLLAYLSDIAALYLRDNLKYTEGTATQILHVVYFLLSALPIIGGTLADSNIGMYKYVFFHLVFILLIRTGLLIFY